MSTSRFFLANLPPKTKEKDLKQIFQDYGEVVKVELKTKENLVEPENVKIIAFVTLRIEEADAQYCLNELNWQKVHGQQLKVSLAKESFLDRLKREREEAESAAAGTKNSDISAEKSAELLLQNSENTRKTFADDVEMGEDDDDDEIVPSLMITKKKAAHSLHNGKIVIQSYETTPIHVINNKQPSRQLDAKSSAADQKRKQSLNKKKNQYQQNKSAIQQSLSGLDVNATNKIKFSDAEDDDHDEDNNHANKHKRNIFGSDNETDDDENLRLDLKPEYFGKKGEQLMKMQTTQSLDPRFKIDAKFVDAEEDDHDNEEYDQNGHENDQENERDWQMGILEQVVGTKIDTTQASAIKAAKNKKMLRFDPLKNEHQKFVRTQKTEVVEKVVAKKQKTKQEKLTTENVEASTPEVSKEVFYVVTDSLSQSLKTRGDGFSLLNMFGSAGTQSEEKREDNLKKVTHEKILVNKMDKNALNPFSYDSSSDENEELTDQIDDANAEDQNKAKKQGKQKKSNVMMESFFIPKNDVRLKEGAKFFKYEKKPEAVENYEEVRNRLKMLIRTKITKSKKQLGGKNKGRNKL